MVKNLKLLLGEYNTKVSAECSTKKIHVAMIGLEHIFVKLDKIYETITCLIKRNLEKVAMY